MPNPLAAVGCNLVSVHLKWRVIKHQPSFFAKCTHRLYRSRPEARTRLPQQAAGCVDETCCDNRDLVGLKPEEIETAIVVVHRWAPLDKLKRLQIANTDPVVQATLQLVHVTGEQAGAGEPKGQILDIAG